MHPANYPVNVLLYEDTAFFRENTVTYNGKRVYAIFPYPTNQFELQDANGKTIAVVPFGTMLDVR